jgi:D-glycero-D-manno-heptose 1,7-bisphosphate phosphatase
MSRAAFLDRDGTINVKPPEGEYVESVAGFRYLPGAEDAVRRLADAGWRVIVVTNQRGIALGRMSHEAVDEIHDRLRALPVDGIYVCPHEEGLCDCRKPGIGLLLQAAADFPDIDLAGSVMIGDSDRDMEAGRRAGCRTIRVGDPPLPSLAEVVDDLLSGG